MRLRCRWFKFAWMSFVLESALCKIIFLVCKLYKTLYNNYKYFPTQYVINQSKSTNGTKINLAGNL